MGAEYLVTAIGTFQDRVEARALTHDYFVKNPNVIPGVVLKTDAAETGLEVSYINASPEEWVTFLTEHGGDEGLFDTEPQIWHRLTPYDGPLHNSEGWDRSVMVWVVVLLVGVGIRLLYVFGNSKNGQVDDQPGAGWPGSARG